jgi:hypothetical protein
MLDAFASGFLVFAYLATALFQLAIVFGAPLMEYSYGGHNKGSPSGRYRILSAFASLGIIGIAGHYMAQLGIFTPLLGAELNAVANWGFAGFALLVAVVTSVFGSKKERGFWFPIAIAMFLAALVVAF